MAEAFLQIVIDNLSSLIKEEIGLIMGVNDEMQKLSSTLTTIQAVLEDAEDKQIESKPIRDWLRKLNALAYEIDDILDECATHVSKLNHANSKLTRYSLKKILHRHKIARRMKHVTEKLDAVAAERTKFHLQEMPVGRPREVAASREMGSLLNELDQIFGREDDREEIVKILVNDVREKQGISVLPIIGMGGLGKTTLARLVFNDPRVVEHFEKRIWVCVSDNFDIKTLVQAMIESGTRSGKASDLQHLDALERRLWELLSQERYLVLLDDVWNDEQDKWFELRDIMSCGSAGASVIVSTRQRKVGDIMRTLPPHCLRGLSDEHCWMLLRQCAFGQDEDVHSKLEVIGKQIAKKCVGVPLAAKALGGILRFKRMDEEWIHVRESNMWSLPQEDKLILPALRLSYHHLPLQLRQCFAYFAAFPKDHQIRREDLIRLWMGHGYISSKGKLQVEDVGNEICDELVLRSVLQQTSRSFPDGHEYCYISMHDLVHDLAQSIMENKVPGTQLESNITAASTIREVSLLDRTVFFPKSFHQDMDISSILKHYTSLRVLDASATTIKDLPPFIVNLKQLRFLNMSRTQIRTLPNSLCSLWNLQILNLDYCHKLVALPKNVRYLHNLQHLCLEDCSSLSEMPPRIGELILLKTLSMFVVDGNRGNQLEELQCLNLSGRLEIRHLERVKDHMDEERANLSLKKNLQDLILWWRGYNLSELGEDNDEKVLEALQPHPNLESLTIRGYNGGHFPLWMTNSTLEKIVEIKIIDCQKCMSLPELGKLSHLKTLRLQNIAVEYIIEDEVQNGNSEKIKFPSLKHLHLINLPNLKGISKEQESEEAFPNLIELEIKRCSSLILPQISSLQKLERLTCSSSTLALFSEMDTLTELNVEIEEKLTCFSVETVVNFSNLRRLVISGAEDICVCGEGEALKALEKLRNLNIDIEDSVCGEGEALKALEKLRDLYIRDCKTMACLPRGLVQHLPGLMHLNIWRCPELVELPEEIKHIQNLESIYLSALDKMVCLPEALQHLSLLGFLFLYNLPQLGSLPHWLHHLTSLRTMSVENCAKVASLPALPNLKELEINGCPELERRCRRGSGEDWHKIAHIPRLSIVNNHHPFLSLTSQILCSIMAMVESNQEMFFMELERSFWTGLFMSLRNEAHKPRACGLLQVPASPHSTPHLCGSQGYN